MGYNSPKNLQEAQFSVSRGFFFNWENQKVVGDHVAVCGDPRTRLLGHLDDFAHEIIANYDRLHKAYMSVGRPDCLRSEDVVYFVMIDLTPVAYVTRGGEVRENPLNRQAPSRVKNMLKAIIPALEEFASFQAKRPKDQWM